MTLNTIFKKAAIAAAVISFSAGASASVLTSIKPLGFIASSIADGVTDTEILVPAGASPHDYSLKPSDVQKIKSADLIVWVGEDVDMFLDSSLKDISDKKLIEIAELSDLTDDMLIKGHHHHHGEDADEHDHNHNHDVKHEEHHHDHDAKHEEHDHDHDAKHEKHDHDHDANHEEHDHDELGVNWHIWTSPDISIVVAKEIAEKLTEQYPDKKAVIAENLAEFNRTLAQKTVDIKKQLDPVKEKGFYVFHDAYTYFNNTYGLNQVGYFTINPLTPPGAKTLAHIKEEIDEHKVQCLFAEPQFTPKVIESLSKATGVKVGRLDPLGTNVKLGKNSYANYLQSMADSYYNCLK